MEPIGAGGRNGGGQRAGFRRAQRALLELVPRKGRPLANGAGGALAQTAQGELPQPLVLRFPGAPTGAEREKRLKAVRARIAGGYYDRPEVRDGMARNMLRSFEQGE